jgi:hypothetical protein
VDELIPKTYMDLEQLVIKIAAIVRAKQHNKKDLRKRKVR